MTEELEWKTRKERVDRKLKSLHPAWSIVRHKPGLDIASLDGHAVEEYPTENGPADYALFVKGRLLGIIEAKKVGVGPAKASLIAAALEFARRRIRPEGLRISFPPDVLPLIRHYADRRQEHFISVSLNGANEVIAARVVSVGLVNKTQVHPREVFADPLTDCAAAVIVAHNHPSGTLEPSQEDIETTGRLKSAGEILGIRLLDHIVFNQKGYCSFLEKGLL
jgi:DNA repair protein RadC